MTNINKGRLFALAQFVIIIVIPLFSYYFQTNSSKISRLAGIILMVSGFLLGFISIINFRQSITPNPVPLKNAHLIKTGLYKYMRHPMYSSVMIIILGCCIYFLSIFSIASMCTLIIFFIYKVRFEEANLIEKFPSYSEYKKATYRFIPFLY